jgi:hypothetical protein
MITAAALTFPRLRPPSPERQAGATPRPCYRGFDPQLRNQGWAALLIEARDAARERYLRMALAASRATTEVPGMFRRRMVDGKTEVNNDW